MEEEIVLTGKELENTTIELCMFLYAWGLESRMDEGSMLTVRNEE